MPARLPTLLRQILFPRSLRGRYLLISILTSMILILAAGIGWYFVRSTTEQQIDRIQARTDAGMLINDLETTTRRVENTLNEFIRSPTEERIRIVHVQKQLLSTAIGNLHKVSWFHSDATLQAILEQLTRDVGKLQERIDELIRIRTTPGSWFPAMQILENSMLPQYNIISTEISLIINEIENEVHTPMERGYLHAFMELRHLVERMVSEFRLLVSNRFGVFSDDPVKAIAVRLNNIQIYRRQIDTILNRLATTEQQAYFDIQHPYSVAEIRTDISRWTEQYETVVAMLLDDNWRYDISYLENDIQPLIAKTHQRLESIKLELAVGSARDITRLTNVATWLSNIVILLAVGSVLVLMLWFIIFNRTLLVPVARISEALRHEARNGEPLHVPEGKVVETRLLTEAFDEMRNQVRSRQAHLDFLAYHDPLTNLPNRALFRDRLQHALDRALRDDKLVSLLFLDLDRFKQINDTLGHDVGDQLLCKMAARIQDNVRIADTVARLGGDEFAIIVEDIDNISQVTPIAEKVLRSFEEPFDLEHRQLHATTSIGIATCPMDGTDAETLFRNADTAMYYSKERGPNGYQHYSDEMTARITAFLLTEFQLRNAIRQKQFTIHYHPIIDIGTGRIAACEALLRWQHDKRGLLLPDDFLKVLEETGLIMPVSHWIIRRTLADFARFKQVYTQPLCLTINFSPNLLQDGSTINILGPAIEANKIDAADIIIEITEEALTYGQGNSFDILEALKEMGVKIAIDDFGKGQSSLSRLRKLPIDIVKIDKDFVGEVPGNSDDSELISAIIAMAHKLRKWVIAEGVEELAQYDFLVDHGCDAVQGYLFNQPMDFDSMRHYLQQPAPAVHSSPLHRKART